MGPQTVDTDPEPVHTGIVGAGHQHHRAHGHIGGQVQTEGALRFIDIALVNDDPCAVADLLAGLPGENDLAGEFIPVGTENTGCADQGGVMGVMAAGVHFAGAQAGIRGAVFLRHRQSVNIRPQDDAALSALRRGLCAGQLRVYAGAGHPPVGDAQSVQLLLDALLGLKLLLGQLRVLMKIPAQAHHIVVVRLHLLNDFSLQLVHWTVPFLLTFRKRGQQSPLSIYTCYFLTLISSVRRRLPSARQRNRTCWSTGSGGPSGCRRWSRWHSPGTPLPWPGRPCAGRSSGRCRRC